MKVLALCHTCRRKHMIDFDPRVGPGAAFGDWLTKHAAHNVDFEWSERSGKTQLPHGGYFSYLENADVKIAYAASANYALTLASLASSSTLVAGRESTAVSNTTNKYLDYLVAGTVRTGTSPTASKTVEVWVYASRNDTPDYPDVFDGTDSAETVTSADIKRLCLALAAVALTDSTSDRDYPYKPVSIAALHGGTCPMHHGLFLTHDTGVALNSTESNHEHSYTGVYATVA